MESDLIPYTASTTLQGLAALVLAPHPDDEVFACGGAIASHVRDGVPVHVVILTDGARFGDFETRSSESEAAARILGYGRPDFWRLPDRGLYYCDELVQRIVERVVNAGVDLVYCPSPWEIHPDHRQTTMLAVEAVRRCKHPVRLVFYEVGAPLRPNVLLDISALSDTKDAAMRCFASQLARQDYSRQVRALNQYRAYTLEPNVLAAEAYWVLTAIELDRMQSTGLFLLASPGPPEDTAASRQKMPLVSILVRSMDRSCLAEALDSIALQTYPHIEVVVVAARPQHRPLPAKCGPFALTLHRTDAPLPRSRAANTAMKQAGGDLFLFLDDDDWLMPGHIARLAHVLTRQPHALAVYTGISLVDAEGRSLGQTFELPFDAIRQMAGNLTPIHAVLFSAKVRDLGCWFDETLDKYEDWDFWLQLGKLAPLVHLPGVSGAYRVHDSSGVHTDAGPEGAAAGLVYQKWWADWTPRQIGQMMQRVWSHPELQSHLADTRQQLADTRQQLADTRHQLALAEQLRERLEQTIAQHEQAIARQNELLASLSSKVEDQARDYAAIRNSRSWRLTRPLRWVVDRIRTSPVGAALGKIRASSRR